MSYPRKPGRRPAATNPWRLTALLACAITTSGCVTIPGLTAARADSAERKAARDSLALQARPPQIETPAAAKDPCELYVLPKDRPLTQADLEIGYATRGVNVVSCDGLRALAVSAQEREHALEAQWLEARKKRARPWWKFW